jgi:hypothetical protein
MTKGILKAGAVFALLLTSASAFADDPTGVLERERGYAPRYPGKLPAYSDSGACYRGMQTGVVSEPAGVSLRSEKLTRRPHCDPGSLRYRPRA